MFDKHRGCLRLGTLVKTLCNIGSGPRRRNVELREAALIPVADSAREFRYPIPHLFFVLDRSDGKALVSEPFSGTGNWAKGVDAKGQPIPDPDKEPKVDGAGTSSIVWSRHPLKAGVTTTELRRNVVHCLVAPPPQSRNHHDRIRMTFEDLQISDLRDWEQAERHLATHRLDYFFPASGPYRRDLYVKHLEFFRAGRARAFLAANRAGKSITSRTGDVAKFSGQILALLAGLRTSVAAHAQEIGSVSGVYQE